MPPEDATPYFDKYTLGSFSYRLFEAVVAALPRLPKRAWAESGKEPDGLSLCLEIPSLTGDDSRDGFIWVDEVVTPSIAFGPNHTHGEADDAGIAEIVDLAVAMICDRILIFRDGVSPDPDYGSWLDTREPDALEEELTSPDSSGEATLQSWSGQADKHVNLQTFHD